MVSTLALTGFDNDSKWYVFSGYAVDQKGRIHRPADNGFFKFSHKTHCAPAPHAATKAIPMAIDSKNSIAGIYSLLSQAWGDRGKAALGWVVGSWFVCQVKQKLGFYPFLSLYGDVQASKSSLVTMLNQFQGFDTEGCSVTSMSTRAGLVRNIGKNSNLFTSLIEGNIRDDRNAFEYSSLLPLYNRNPLQEKAQFTNDLRTSSIPFQGALCFSSNVEVFQGKAEKERTISIQFKTTDLTPQTKAAYDQLSLVPLPAIATILPKTLEKREQIENDWYSFFLQACEDLKKVSNRRIRENHALVLAFHRLFREAHGIKGGEQTQPFVQRISLHKEASAAKAEYTISTNFFEQLDLIEEEKRPGCVYLDDKDALLYICLSGVEKQLRHMGLQFVANDRLFQALKEHPSYLEHSKVFRFPDDPRTGYDGRPKQRRAWVFDATKI